MTPTFARTIGRFNEGDRVRDRLSIPARLGVVEMVIPQTGWACVLWDDGISASAFFKDLDLVEKATGVPAPIAAAATDAAA